ncbi:MAG TPA: PEP/pyruvate-binding domain-containing protein, partial [Bacteroidales bacterium]|nr:PEP/pyruvate-binding domain-containing protein [Bacteroidales bacterium]
MAFLFQSSDKSNAERARQLNAGFLWKQSKSLSHELKQYIIENFGFGDLVFSNPKGKGETIRIHDLADLQKFIFDISDEAFIYHARRNEISRWLNARALFSIGSLFKDLQIEDFETLNQARSCIFDAIAIYRITNCKGVIASFNKNDFNEYLTFCRIGEGSLGGKGRGLAFLDALIRRHNLYDKFEKTHIVIPRTVVIATDLFDEFMEQNDLYKIASSESDDKKILEKFLKASLPNRLYHDLQNYVKKIQNPVAVRSSSKLEDSHFMPFAGVYRTYMVPYSKDEKKMAEMLCDAIKCVYASVYYKESKAYMASTSSVIDEEKMAIILEEVCGKAYQDRFYPAMSGVARSVNYYPVLPETAGDGVVNIAYGLGKYLVDGGSGMRFCPKYPKKALQLSVPELA